MRCPKCTEWRYNDQHKVFHDHTLGCYPENSISCTTEQVCQGVKRKTFRTILSIWYSVCYIRTYLLLTFVDLEKPYDRVPMDLVYLCLRRRRVSEKLVRLVEATYHGESTVVRTMRSRTDEFPIKVGLHQGSGLSPFLFIIVLDVKSEEFRCGLSSELLFADDTEEE